MVDKVIDAVKKIDGNIITSKVGDYYIDDNNNIWTDEFILIGVHDNNKMHFYVDIKKIVFSFSVRFALQLLEHEPVTTQSKVNRFNLQRFEQGSSGMRLNTLTTKPKADVIKTPIG